MNAPGDIPTPLTRLLARAGRRVRAARAFRTAALGLAAILQAAGIAMLADAWLDLPETARIATLFLLTAVALVSGLRAATAWRTAPEMRRLARRLERRAKIAHNVLCIGADLAASAAPRSSEPLRAEALRRADEAATRVAPGLAVDAKPQRRAVAIALASLAFHVALAALLPGVHAVSLNRFTRPWPEQAPYTRLKFDIDTNPATPLRGDAATLRVRVSSPDRGGVPDRASWVIESPTGDRRMMTARAAAGDGSRAFELRLAALNEPMVGYVRTPLGRSERFTLAPREPEVKMQDAAVAPGEADAAALDRRTVALAGDLSEAARAARTIDEMTPGDAEDLADALASASNEALALARAHPAASTAARLRALSRSAMSLATAVASHGRQPLDESLGELERTLREIKPTPAASPSGGRGESNQATGVASRGAGESPGVPDANRPPIEPAAVDVLVRPGPTTTPVPPAEIDAMPLRFRAAARSYFDRLSRTTEP